MKVMVIIKANKDSEAGQMYGRYGRANLDLLKARLLSLNL